MIDYPGVIANSIMRGTGFEPAQALSYSLLRAARLTTPTPPHIFQNRILLKKITFSIKIQS